MIYIIIIFLCGQIVEHALAAYSEDTCGDTCDDTYCEIQNDPVSINPPYLLLVIPQLELKLSSLQLHDSSWFRLILQQSNILGMLGYFATVQHTWHARLFCNSPTYLAC